MSHGDFNSLICGTLGLFYCTGKSSVRTNKTKCHQKRKQEAELLLVQHSAQISALTLLRPQWVSKPSYMAWFGSRVVDCIWCRWEWRPAVRLEPQTGDTSPLWISAASDVFIRSPPSDQTAAADWLKGNHASQTISQKHTQVQLSCHLLHRRLFFFTDSSHRLFSVSAG